ncbi:Flagellar basal-body rod protein FlgG [Planctomycetes bacterium Pan216]|uniref:Flagellar basal-body rod protein FlgG n=1 Tax=Kolteria novifilia TaxID=2527975 RepID=A0A518B4Z6_9BACT|nr:Flagellar basal-body rod protein FlgG [Planctomycetes bacterium Pan216]
MSFDALQTSATGMLGATTKVSVVGNNIANVNSTAFKSGRVDFADLFYDLILSPGIGLNPQTESPLGKEFGDGVQVVSVTTNYNQGPPIQGLPLDLYINSPQSDFPAFFRVTDPDGNILYTRNGAFEPKAAGAQGQLRLEINNVSYPIDPPITLTGDPGGASVSRDGFVFEGNNPDPIGRIELSRFQNPDGLVQLGQTFYVPSGSSGDPIDGFPLEGDFIDTEILDNTLEGSNVNLTIELVDLIQASQMFQSSAQAFQTANEELTTTLDLFQQT